MRRKDTLTNSFFNDTSPDKLKKNKTKSPMAASNKTRQSYVQNLEKKLDEIMAASADTKKTEKKGFGANTNAMLNSLGKTTGSNNPNQGTIEERDFKKVDKKKMCKMYMVLRTCRNGDACPFAHSYKELTVEYKPNEWVKFFTQKSQRNLKLPTATSTQNDFRKTTDHNKFKIHSSGKFLPTQESQPENINKIINTKGRTLLIEACLINDVDNATVLIRQGADPTQRDWFGYDSIFYTIKNCNPSLLEIILGYSSDKIDLNQRFSSAQINYLILAAKVGNYKILDILLNYGANPDVVDKLGKTALFYCAETNFVKGVELLISRGADLLKADKSGKAVLDYAFEKKLIEVIDILIRKGASSNNPHKSKDKSLILICAQYNLKEALVDLINRVASINEVDENENNFLMVAYENGHIDLIEHCINNYGFSDLINQQNKRKDNLLFRAIKDQNEYLIQFLLANPKVDIRVRDEVQKTPLMYAAELGDYKTVETLLDRGADPKIDDKYSRTALIFACKNDHVLVVEALLRQPNIRVNFQDKVGKTAKHYTKNKTILAMLRNYMIENNELSASLIKELEDEKYNIKKILGSQ